MKLTYMKVNGYLIPNLTYKSGEQMEQLGKYGFLRRDYLKNHRNSMYQVMLLQDTIGEHLIEVDKAAREREEDFQKYLRQKGHVSFTFRNKEYHVESYIYPQGFAAVFYRLQDFKGINMLADIGNGTLNIMYINNSRPVEKKCFTEKYGTHQCMLSVRESLLKELGIVEDDLVIKQVIRTRTADIGEKYLSVIRKIAGEYIKKIFHKLREREYNPELMRLYVVGGGGCMIWNFGEYDKSRVTIGRDICATAKGYEAMTVRKIQRNGGMLV